MKNVRMSQEKADGGLGKKRRDKDYTEKNNHLDGCQPIAVGRVGAADDREEAFL
jgi:hypothetical protein